MHKLPLSIRAVARGCNNPLPVAIRRSGFLKILALIFSLSFFTAPGAYAQGGWEAPVTAWDPTWFMRPIVTPGGIKAQHGLLLYWQRATCDKSGNMIGSPRVAIYNADPGVTVSNVSVTAVGIGCDGKQGTSIYQASELRPYDRKANNYWDRCYFRVITKVVAVRFDYDIGNLHYYVQYDQEQGVNSIKINGMDQDEWLKQQQQKAQDLKRQVADAKKKFDNIVATYNLQLNSLRNAQTKSSFSNALNNWQRQFNTGEQLAQQYLTVTDKDKVQPQLELLNDITEKLNKNLGELNTAVEKEKQVQANTKPGSTGGAQNTNTNTNANQSHTTASTNGNVQTNQRATTTTTTSNSNVRNTQSQVYQQQADSYLNAANNSSDAIQQSLNLNLAKTNASAAGNTYQVQQIQQAQNQAQQANQQAMASSLGDLASATMGYFDQKARNKELDRQQALEYQQYERQRQAEMQAAQRAQEQEQAKRNAALQAERQAALQRQWNTDKEALGDYLTHKTSSTIPENKKEAFFIVYERLHPSGTSYSVVKMRTYAIEKYSDGTWMPIIDLLNKLKCTEAFDLDRTKIGLGYFPSKQEALQFIENIKGYFKERVTTDMSFITINQSLQSTPQKDNFWNQ
ncbi:cell envelope integrity protein TolA [Pinibacter aurantiacus]|uniref:Uncharacterized protein n=1 Tax=Pinibacter aurantiacus TaxID=2851599 RepID=A0A9E2SEX4_9BACT|nr:cell envelope integrity protein TolA [Pinibacter aurantiacus]MBV4360564.1 hypothetical protein [Pinibacter aurantiacus]